MIWEPDTYSASCDFAQDSMCNLAPIISEAKSLVDVAYHTFKRILYARLSYEC